MRIKGIAFKVSTPEELDAVLRETDYIPTLAEIREKQHRDLPIYASIDFQMLGSKACWSWVPGDSGESYYASTGRLVFTSFPEQGLRIFKQVQKKVGDHEVEILDGDTLQVGCTKVSRGMLLNLINDLNEMKKAGK